MPQIRNKTGIEFEKHLPKNFVRKPTSPKISWVGSGRNNFKKMAECGYDEKKFSIDFDKTSLVKYDWVDTITDKKYEVKKYTSDQLKKWSLYSEPYFKMSSKQNLKLISHEKYNDFVGKFFKHHQTTGLFDRIIKEITTNLDGIYCQNGFFTIDKFEFKTVVIHNQWKKYDRITIMFRFKEN